jgi:hypothetical protein
MMASIEVCQFNEVTSLTVPVVLELILILQLGQLNSTLGHDGLVSTSSSGGHSALIDTQPYRRRFASSVRQFR